MCYTLAEHRERHSFPTRRSSDLAAGDDHDLVDVAQVLVGEADLVEDDVAAVAEPAEQGVGDRLRLVGDLDRKSTRLNSSHSQISYAVFCWKKKILTKSVSTCRIR